MSKHAMRVSALAALGVALLSAAASGQVGAPFTEDERRRLIAGELVQRPVTRREGEHRYFGGTSWQRVPAPPDRVFETILDVTNYPSLIPGVVEARLEVDDGDRRVVFLRHQYGILSASYSVEMWIDRYDRSIRFDVDHSRPADIRAGHGFLTVDGYRGDTIVGWGVMADIGSGLVTSALQPLLRDWILRVPSCVRGHMQPGEPAC